MKVISPKKGRAPAATPRRRAATAVSTHAISPRDLNLLQTRLREAQETLEAVRQGGIDPVVLGEDEGPRVSPPGGADQPLRIFVDSMQEGALTVAADGTVQFCNRRFAAMLDEPLEQVLHSELPGRMAPGAWARIAGVLAGEGASATFETTLRRESDTGLPVQVAASRLPADGPPVACLIVTDLTPAKEREDLQRAREAAERSAAAKDDFLSALSHELRTPLTPALMAATVLEKDIGLPETARSDVSLIRRNIELEARLIDDLLDLTLITRGNLTLQKEDLNLHAVLNRAIEACQGEVRLKRLNMQIELQAKQTQILGDPIRVQQACWNVLRNAVKFTPERGTISIGTGNDRHNQVWIRIADTGVGFTHDQAARLFEPFKDGGRQATRRSGGLGLGLAITRSIMHAHGGGVEAQSAGPNQGATFTLRFPLAHAATEQLRPGEAPYATLPGLSILLVEDHKDTRVCIQRLLEASAHRVTSAGSAQDALAVAESGHFDLVISDLGLPDLSGHELMQRLHTRFNLPGIALSGYGMETDMEKSREAGFKYHLTKPVSFDQLKSFIAEIAANREAGAGRESLEP